MCKFYSNDQVILILMTDGLKGNIQHQSMKFHYIGHHHAVKLYIR